MKRKKYEEMTISEYIDYNNRKADKISKVATCFSIVSVLMLILAYLDKIVLFLRYVF